MTRHSLPLRSLFLILTSVSAGCAVAGMMGFDVLLVSAVAGYLAVGTIVQAGPPLLSGFWTVAASTAAAMIVAPQYSLINAAIAGGIVGGVVWTSVVERVILRSANDHESQICMRRWCRIGSTLAVIGIVLLAIFKFCRFVPDETTAVSFLAGVVSLVLGVPHIVVSMLMRARVACTMNEKSSGLID